MNKKISIVILAAGKGTRLGVETPKPLVSFQQTNLIHQVITEIIKLKNHAQIKLSVILGHQKEMVQDYLNKNFNDLNLEFVYQDKQLGTGHAVSEFINQTKSDSDEVMILCADTPLITKSSLTSLIDFKNNSNLNACGLSFIAKNPQGYGRIKRVSPDRGISIIEEKDASAEERKINEVNSGIYLVDQSYLLEKIGKLDNKNKSGEFYLTDIMGPNDNCGFITVKNGEDIFLGVNTMTQLEQAEQLARKKMCEHLQLNGVCIIDSNTTYIDNEVKIEPGVKIMPNVHLRGKTIIKKNSCIETGCVISDTIIGENVKILPYTVLEDSQVLNGASVGPFARIRPGSQIGEECKVGNFVETKKSILKPGAKVSHLSYVGDAEIGQKTNIGCGFITCNYDGKNKHQTIIGENCFIGSDSQVIAPVTIGDNCYVASGSTINSNLNDGDFAISRSRQVTKEGMAKRFLKK